MITTTTTQGAEIGLRAIENDDVRFVADAWTRCVQADPPWHYRAGVRGSSPRQPSPIPHPLLRTETDTLLKKNLPKMRIAIAHDVSDVNHIVAFCAEHDHNEQPVLDFVYVKTSFRRFGIASALLKNTTSFHQEKIVISYRTGMLYQCFPRRQFLWNPYRMFID